MSPVAALVLVALCVIGVGAWMLNRWFARRSAGAQAQLAFKRRHGARVVELLGAGADRDRRRNSPWIDIRWGSGSAGLVSARLHQGRMQAAIRLDDVRLPVEIWEARRDGSSDFDAVDGIDRERAAVLIAQLAELGVDSVCAGDLDGYSPPVVRVQYDDVEELPERCARIGELLDALVELRVDDER